MQKTFRSLFMLAYLQYVLVINGCWKYNFSHWVSVSMSINPENSMTLLNGEGTKRVRKYFRIPGTFFSILSGYHLPASHVCPVLVFQLGDFLNYHFVGLHCLTDSRGMAHNPWYLRTCRHRPWVRVMMMSWCNFQRLCPHTSPSRYVTWCPRSTEKGY